MIGKMFSVWMEILPFSATSAIVIQFYGYFLDKSFLVKDCSKHEECQVGRKN